MKHILPEMLAKKILQSDEAFKRLESMRKGNVLVFTNGCFDIIHKGHLHLLSKAREMGDLLVVGLNSDQSVRRLKGTGRPVKDQETRAALLASLSFVDYVCLFTEDTPAKLIEKISPEILVKGGDYQLKDIIGAEHVQSYGGKVITIPFLEGYSSTSLIDKLKKV